jgi:hypothetical protein
LDKQSKPSIPRIAIRMQGDQIGEVRGVADNQQNLEGNMTEIAEKKTDTLPGKEKYKKISADMEKMTEIYKKCFKEDRQTGEKTYLKTELSKNDLLFLYEVNSTIEGFGYQKDPRIKEIREKRNLQEDLPIFFDCKPSQIALKPEDIKSDTVAYIGVWNPAVLKSIPPSVKHIYEHFPDEKVFLKTIETDPNIKSSKEAEKALSAKGIKIYDRAKEILQKTPFSKELIKYDLVSFSVESLGFPKGATTAEIYQKAQELGLELCPAEVGPLLRLNYLDQPNNDYLAVAMKAIETSDGDPLVFIVDRHGSELWLFTSWVRPDFRWVGGFRFVFLRRKY